MPYVEVAVDEYQVATITLNDPDHRNAMGSEMAAEFRACIQELKQSDAIRALILTGKGKAFSAGGDLQMLKAKSELDFETNRERMLDFYDSFLGILDLPYPVIAAVNGHAIGAGLCVSMACDYRVISTGAKLGFTFTKLGLHPGMGATFLVPRIAGHAVATDLLVSGRVFDAAEALSLGLCHSVAAPNDVLTEATAWAKSVLLTGPTAIQGLLETLRPSPTELRAALEREAEQQAQCYASPEFIEGVNAAIEKRPPRF